MIVVENCPEFHEVHSLQKDECQSYPAEVTRTKYPERNVSGRKMTVMSVSCRLGGV